MNFTNQELFDKAYIGVVKQGVSSMAGASCAYRGDNGTTCGVGHLFSPEFRATVPEGVIDNLLNSEPSVREFFGYVAAFPSEEEGLQRALLRSLQRAHDVAADPDQDDYFDRDVFHTSGAEGFIDSFIDHMVDIAAYYNLTVPKES